MTDNAENKATDKIEKKQKRESAISLIVDMVSEEVHPVTFQRSIWTCTNGLYREDNGHVEKRIIELLKQGEEFGSIVSATKAAMYELTYYAAEIYDDYPFDCYPNALPVSNGVLIFDWKNKRVRLEQHDCKYKYTYKLPVIYDENADKNAMKEILEAWTDNEEDAMILIQIIAHIIVHAAGGVNQTLKRSVIIEGPSNGGKSTFVIDLLNMLFGEENISNVFLDELCNNKYAKYFLVSKILNRADDLQDIPLKDVGMFKSLTGSFYHTVERKHHDHYNAKITCPHVFTCNSPPKVPENVINDPAFWNRWTYLRFNNVFDIDSGFVEREFTPERLSGLLNAAIVLAFEIADHNDLIYTHDAQEVQQRWSSSATPFIKFRDEEMVRTSDYHTYDKDWLFTTFRKWCEEHNVSPKKIPKTLASFTQLILPHGVFDYRTQNKKVYRSVFKFNPNSAYRPSDRDRKTDQKINFE